MGVQLSCNAPLSAADSLWEQLVPPRQAELDPTGSYQLQAEQGPWLIVAATFSGDGAQEQCRQLATELRRDYNLKAYVHHISFNLAEEAPTRGLDAYGRPRRAKFRRGDEVTEYAVLVGDFPAVDDMEAQRVLKQVKQIRPKSLTGEHREKTTQNLAGWRSLKNVILKGNDDVDQFGPMGSAFITRNPLLPAEFFVPRGVDQFIEDMNRGVKYCLLDAPGKYSVQVATFRGRSTLKGLTSRDSSRSQLGRDENPLAEAAANAHNLTSALRFKNWEAYEFHDRDESIVTIGSFDTVAEQQADGRVVPTRDVAIILRTFDASYEPVVSDPNDLAALRKAEEVKQQFNRAFSRQHGQIASGLHPRSVIGIPLDIHPHVIVAPKRSISTAYVRVPR